MVRHMALPAATNPETTLLQLVHSHTTYLRLARAGSGEDENEGDGGGVGETRHVCSSVAAWVRDCVSFGGRGVIWGEGWVEC